VWCLLSFGYRNAFDATSIMLSLNAYFYKYLEIIAIFNDFTIQHVFRDENIVVNDLAQQASGFLSNRENLYALENWMFWFVADAQC
jgi:Mlc titration factor MtfA (ptsG expression regulator)